MPHFPRVALGVLVFGSLLAAHLAGAQENKTPAKSPTKKVAVLYSHIEILRDEDALKKLLKERFNTAVDELNIRLLQFETGGGGLKSAQEVAGRVVAAGLELCEKPEEKVTLLTKHLALMTLLQAAVEASFLGGQSNTADVANAKYYRLDAEIQLLRAKRR